MARISEEFLQRYHAISDKEVQNPIIFVVDMINGFVKEGALHDEAIMDCVSPIQTLIDTLACRSIFIADAHPKQAREFISYPTHCVVDTAESEIIDELKPYVQELIQKNSTNAFTTPAFQSFLEEEIVQYQDIILTGCCSDICILQFALCLNSWLNEHNKKAIQIVIPLDSIDTYHIDGIHDACTNNAFAIANMEANGIRIVSHIESEGGSI